MHDQSDAQLLRAYAERGAETAFAEIVARHTDLVYSAALRQVYSPDLARDVTQSVFTDLARKACEVSFKLSPQVSLVGWLYRGTQFAARDLYRYEARRTQRERQAMEQLQTDSGAGGTPAWSEIATHLDDAMSELDDTDRDAVLLRYFKNHDLRTVGATLGISDDAAQKRVSRAVEKLREFFAKRGVTVGASGVAVVISANAVQAAPVGLAVTISTAAALTGTTLATTATITATKAIVMTTLQKTIITATIAALAGAGIYEARQALQLRDQVQTLQQQLAPLTAHIQQLQHEHDDATNRLASLSQERANTQINNSELLRLRGDVGVLKRQVEEANIKVQAAEKKLAVEQSAQAQFLKHENATANATKLLGLAVRMYSADNNNQFPTNILQTSQFLGGKFNIDGIDIYSLEFIPNRTGNAEHSNMVEFRERLSRQAPDGTWRRIYGFSDGSVQTATSNDGNFDAWEKVNTYSPPPNQNQ